MTVSTTSPDDTAAMLCALLGSGYRVSLTLAPESSGYPAGYLADLTGPLGSQDTGFGDSPAAALASVWPLGAIQGAGPDEDLACGPAGEDGRDEDLMDDPAVAAVARTVAALREYAAGALAGAAAVSVRDALAQIASTLESVGALLATDPSVIEAGPGDELEPCCRTCGRWIGRFFGMDGWQHFRGEPAAGGRRTLYDAGHDADPEWRVPPGRVLSPADVADARTAAARDAMRPGTGCAPGMMRRWTSWAGSASWPGCWTVPCEPAGRAGAGHGRCPRVRRG